MNDLLHLKSIDELKTLLIFAILSTMNNSLRNCGFCWMCVIYLIMNPSCKKILTSSKLTIGFGMDAVCGAASGELRWTIPGHQSSHEHSQAWSMEGRIDVNVLCNLCNRFP